jgi:uracil-DNA glycosylase family 4
MNELELLEEKIIYCRLCPRLVSWREEVARKKKRAYMALDYWGKPVPGFGDSNARILIVGLAPGAHGSNRTGRMFTGDASGVFLYRALFKQGFANQPTSVELNDGLKLEKVFISALCRCVPPDNKPSNEEIQNCRPYLLKEMELLSFCEGIVALGGLAYRQLQIIYSQIYQKKITKPFSHGAFVNGEGRAPWLLSSYHPSQQNTNTNRLTVEMFDSIWEKARLELEAK